MSARPRLLRRVRDLRERLRDAQAGATNIAVAAAADAHAAEENARAAAEQRVEVWLAELGQQHSVAALLRLEDERRWREREAAALAEVAQKAEAYAQSERRELSARERSLRSIERALDQNRALREKTEARAEQGASDDLSGAKAARAGRP